MISCTRCLAVASTYEIEEEMEEEWEVPGGGCKEYDPNCLECKLQRHIASQSTVPENVWEVFEKSIRESEDGLFGWVTRLNSYRIIRILTYPYKLPFHVAYVSVGDRTEDAVLSVPQKFQNLPPFTDSKALRLTKRKLLTMHSKI